MAQNLHRGTLKKDKKKKKKKKKKKEKEKKKFLRRSSPMSVILRFIPLIVFIYKKILKLKNVYLLVPDEFLLTMHLYPLLENPF